MPLPKERIHTIDDIYNLPEGERAELINGQIYYMAPPSTAHQRTLSFLHLEIGNHIRNNNGSCEVFPAPFAVFLQAEDEKNNTNLALYQGAGVREYWIVDPAREIIVVYDFPNETPPTIYRFNDSVKVNIYEDFSIDFSQLKL